MKIGLGIDYHCMVGGRPLILGGINIPHDKGLDGHSDADVVLHAVADAILGALCLGDIGHHFPNTDQQWKDVASTVILQKTYELMQQQSYRIGNVDIMLLLEKPKIAPYIQAMRTHIAKCLDCDSNCVSIKATTAEGLGFVGREEGASAHSVVLLKLVEP